MQEKKTLTFVVPAYNMTEYLERCVESLIASKRNDDIEVLIVDDGSSDGTPSSADRTAKLTVIITAVLICAAVLFLFCRGLARGKQA